MRIEALASAKAASPWEAYEDYRRALIDRQGESPSPTLTAGETQERPETKRVNDSAGCESCKNRKYQDGSNDPGVSFKTPTRISADQAAGAVRAHEMEHVSRERGSAAREDREVVSQSVVYHTAICAECGRSYVSGGTTRTTTRARTESPAARRQEGKLDTYG